MLGTSTSRRVARSARTSKDTRFELGIGILLVIVMLVAFVPLLYVLMISLTPIGHSEDLLLPPWLWTVEAYKQLLGQPAFIQATVNSLIITIGGVSINIVLTVLTAYPLASKSLPGRNFFLFFILFTYLFNAGLIPTYLLVKNLNLINSFPAVILPGAISVYNLFIMRSFFQALPESLDEAARIDGANDWQVLWNIVLPLSKPILLTIGLFYAVSHWNEFFLPVLYLNDKNLQPLPVILHDILSGTSTGEYVDSNVVSATSEDALKMAAVILAVLPMLLVYPWIQRHFTKGVLLGGVKE